MTATSKRPVVLHDDEVTVFKPTDLDLSAAQQEYDNWYRNSYLPRLHEAMYGLKKTPRSKAPILPKFKTFAEFLEREKGLEIDESVEYYYA